MTRSRPRFRAAGMTHAGKIRETNEDQYLVCEIRRRMHILDTSLPRDLDQDWPIRPPGYLLVLADGVGGAARGEKASRVAIDAFLEYITGALSFGEAGSSLEDDLLRELGSGVASSHARVLDQGRMDPRGQGMATTFTLAFVLGRRALITHVGDSRCYLLRDGRADRLTKDQTFAQELVDRGVMKAEEAEGSRWSHVLSSAVGGAADQEPEILGYRTILQDGDYLVLCTDGLGKHVSEQEMASIVASSPTEGDACRALVNAALEGGGSDNITVIVGRLEIAEEGDGNVALE